MAKPSAILGRRDLDFCYKTPYLFICLLIQTKVVRYIMKTWINASHA